MTAYTMRTIPLRLSLFLGSLTVAGLLLRSAGAYQAAQHYHLGQTGRTYYGYYAQNPTTRHVGVNALQQHWATVNNELEHEDDDFNPLWHFWDPDQGDGAGLVLQMYPLPIWISYDSAYERAHGLWVLQVLANYASPTCD